MNDVNTNDDRTRAYHLPHTFHVNNQAYKDGHDHGVEDANGIEWTDPLAYNFLMEQTDEIDPSGPLSGEWADGLLPQDLVARYNLPTTNHDDTEELQEVCDAYESGYYEGYYTQAEVLAHEHLESN